MLKSNYKNNLITNSIIDLGDDIAVEGKGKGRKFVSRFIEPGVAEYKGTFGKILITKETLDKFIRTIIGVPVIIKHKDIDNTNVDKERVGVVSEVWYNPEDGWYYCSGILFDSQAIDLVKNQGWSVSCTYDFETDNKKGTYHGLDYNMQFTNGEFLHLALVPNPRYERANIVVNSKDTVLNWLKKDEIGGWVTTKGGAKIPIRKGLTSKEGIKEFAKTHIEKQKQKNKKRDEAYTILEYASGKDKNYLKQNLKKSPKLQEEIKSFITSDTLKTMSNFEDMQYYNTYVLEHEGTNDTTAQEELITEALDDILTDNFDSVETTYEGYEKDLAEYYQETEKRINEGYKKIISEYKKDKDWDKAEQKLADLYGFESLEDFADEAKLTEFYKDMAETYNAKSQNSLTSIFLDAISEVVEENLKPNTVKNVTI